MKKKIIFMIKLMNKNIMMMTNTQTKVIEKESDLKKTTTRDYQLQKKIK